MLTLTEFPFPLNKPAPHTMGLDKTNVFVWFKLNYWEETFLFCLNKTLSRKWAEYQLCNNKKINDQSQTKEEPSLVKIIVFSYTRLVKDYS